MRYDQRFAEFNESTYAQLATGEVTRALLQHDDLVGIPITPTLRDESDLGYDMSVPAKWGMVYLQYKLSEYMRGGNAKEYAFLNRPYFRFTVKTGITSNYKIQHNTLCDLETLELRRGGLVYYMAPIFLTENELLSHFSNDTVVDHSIVASPLQLGPVAQNAVHRYTYTHQRNVRPFSEPGPERTGDFDQVLDAIRQSASGIDRVPLSIFLERTAVLLREVSGLDADSAMPAVQQIARISFALSLQPLVVQQAARPEDGEGQTPFVETD